jgi:D-3-phosphoglycerate dehydrogenase
LAEKLGKFAAQYSDERVNRLVVRYSGEVVNYPSAPITTAIVKGFLEPSTDDNVNFINALKKLDNRGVEVVSETHSRTHNYTSLIEVVTELANGSKNSFSGTMFTEDRQRLVILNDKHFDAYLEGNMIVIENNDVPGVIGAVGTLFGEKKINIGQMTWGRTEHNQEAMTVVNIDQELSPETIAEIAALPNIKSARMIKI